MEITSNQLKKVRAFHELVVNRLLEHRRAGLPNLIKIYEGRVLGIETVMDILGIPGGKVDRQDKLEIFARIDEEE